jgi:hypothetical protein
MVEVNSMTVVSVMNVVYFHLLVYLFLSFGAAPLSGPGPPHSRGF